jgi:DNA-directed RNA polymerase subunit alpha
MRKPLTPGQESIKLRVSLRPLPDRAAPGAPPLVEKTGMTSDEKTAPAVDLAEILGTEDVADEQWIDLRRKVHCSILLHDDLARLLEDFKAVAKRLSSENKTETRRGIALWLLGREREAVAKLEAVRASREGMLVGAMASLDVDACEKGLEMLVKAREGGDTPLTQSLHAELLIKTGKAEEARAILDRLPKKTDEVADTQYLKGLARDFQGETEEALGFYEKTLELDPAHPRALFRLAFLHDLHGDDARAQEILETLRKQRPVHVNTVLNLGLLYEDRGDFQKAVSCYQTVLDTEPNHTRARLYLSDAKASLTMYYDEDLVRKEQKLDQVLGTPVAEFQLSMRAQNCLNRLGLKTLSQLISKTEDELLETPNFGQATLKEIKELLAARGLTLSTTRGAPVRARDLVRMQDQAEKEGILAKPVSDFEWSERIRKAFEKLKVRTIGEIVSKTEQEFLSCENFGQTSLKELKKRLGQMGLTLKT